MLNDTTRDLRDAQNVPDDAKLMALSLLLSSAQHTSSILENLVDLNEAEIRDLRAQITWLQADLEHARERIFALEAQLGYEPEPMFESWDDALYAAFAP